MGRHRRWWLGLAAAPAASADRILFISDRNSGEVWVMDADGTGQAAVTRRVPKGHAPAWSPDASRIVFGGYSESTTRLWIMAPDGSGLRRLGFPSSAESDWSLYEPDWSPDGRRIVFSYRTDIHVVRRDGQGRKRLLGGEMPSVRPGRRTGAGSRSPASDQSTSFARTAPGSSGSAPGGLQTGRRADGGSSSSETSASRRSSTR